MADFLRITASGNDELQAYLSDAVRRVREPAELMTRLADRLIANIHERFDDKLDPDGNRWQPLRPSTVARYEKEDEGRRQGTLLQRLGYMRKSLGPGAVGSNYAEVGMSRLSDTTKGGKQWSIPMLHEFGTDRMARRGIFFSDPEAGTLGAQDEEMLSEEIAAYLDEVFGG